jgi:hypothetical protein
MVDKKRLKFRVIVIYFGVSVIYIDYMKLRVSSNQQESKMNTVTVTENSSKYADKWLAEYLNSNTKETRDDIAVSLKAIYPCAKIYIGGTHVAVIDPVDKIRTVMITGDGADWI